MYSRSFTAAAVALAASQLAFAQTSTDCNPMEVECPADPAFSEALTIDFTQGESEYFKAVEGTTVTYNDQGMVMSIDSYKQAPTMISTKYIFGGRVDCDMQVAPGAGIVTSFVLQSDDLDEIDWEWVGNDSEQAQSNYFGKGDDSTFDRGAYHDVANSASEVHTYSIDWKVDEYVKWIVDGTTVRTLTYDEAKGGTRFPQTPAEIRLGSWVAGAPGQPKGTIEWAGGVADMSKAPFVAYYKSCKITPAETGVSKYVWDAPPNDGSYNVITSVKGDGSDDDGDDTTSTTKGPSSTTSAAPSSTKPAESTKTSEGESSTTMTKPTGTTTGKPTGGNGGDSTPTPTGTDSAPTPTGDNSGSDESPSQTPSPSADPDSAGVKSALSPIALAAGLLLALF